MDENDDQMGRTSKAQAHRGTHFIERLPQIALVSFLLALLGVVLILVAAHWAIPPLGFVGKCLQIPLGFLVIVLLVWFLYFEAWVASTEHEGHGGSRAIPIAFGILLLATLVGFALLLCSTFGGIRQLSYAGLILVLPFGACVALYIILILVSFCAGLWTTAMGNTKRKQ